MRKLVQSKKAIKILSDSAKSANVRKAVDNEKSNHNSNKGQSGTITVRRVAAGNKK